MEYLHHALGSGASADKNVVAAQADAKVDIAAIHFRLHFLVDLVIDYHGESILLTDVKAVSEEVDQVRHCVERTCSDADTVRYKLVCVRRPVAH